MRHKYPSTPHLPLSKGRQWDDISLDDFAANMGKYVREAHVQTDTHWMFAEIVPNGLRINENVERS